jgi:hypothetical protein
MPIGSALSPKTPEKDLEIVANHLRKGASREAFPSLLLSRASSVGWRSRTSTTAEATVVVSCIRRWFSVFFGGGRHGGVLQQASGPHRPSTRLGGHPNRCSDRFLLPRPWRQAQAGRLATAMTNMIMGPPIFAPLLFGTSAYLGLIASYLQREESTGPASIFG